MMQSSTIPALRGVLLGALTLATIAFAADTGTVSIGGTVATTVAVTVGTPLAGATTLELNTASEQVVKVADLGVSTNNSTGLTLTVTSGNMVKASPDAAITPIAYKVTTVADAAAAPAGSAFSVASGTPYTRATSAAGSAAYALYIAYTPAVNQDPGAYSATINVSVADN